VNDVPIVWPFSYLRKIGRSYLSDISFFGSFKHIIDSNVSMTL